MHTPLNAATLPHLRARPHPRSRGLHTLVLSLILGSIVCASHPRTSLAQGETPAGAETPQARPASPASQPDASEPAHALDKLAIRHDRYRPLKPWKPAIQAYSKRHYGEATAELKASCIVLHFTAGTGFPKNLVESTHFAGEAPGLASHYVVDGTTIWELLPPTVRSRGAYGINHRAINIEMVAANARDLARRSNTLHTCARLVAALQQDFHIPTSKIYSHSAVSRMKRSLVPEVYDRVDPRPYGKPDPGDANMKTIVRELRNL